MGIINKLYDVHAVPSKNVQYPINEEARKKILSQCNFGLHRKPPPGLPRLPMFVGTFSKVGVKMFFVWNGNHRTLGWMKYINDMHPDEKSWHYWVSSLLLDAPENDRSLVKAAMTNINEYVIYIPNKLCFNDIAIIF